MDRALAEMVLREIYADNNGIDLFSKEYFFKRDHAEHRSAVVICGGALSHRSRLSILLREGMTEAYRIKIFDGKYQLGNMLEIPEELCTYKLLTDELYGEKHDIEANDAFETLKKGIESITGRKMREHYKTSRSTTFKVIGTLHRLRQPRLFQLLSSPSSTKKTSMSFRDAYPYTKNQEQVWSIADLKAYLSAELSDERFEGITLAFADLRAWINVVLHNVEQSLFLAYRHNYQLMVEAYGTLTKEVVNFRCESAVNGARLDEVLFTHLCGLEDAHFYAGYAETVNIAIPAACVTPVWNELRKLINTIFSSPAGQFNESDELIQLGELTQWGNRWRQEILAVVETAMGETIKSSEFDKTLEGAYKIMRIDCLFGRNGKSLLQDESALVSVLHVVAAFCCVLYSTHDNTNLKPYWHGQRTQGGSVTKSNKEYLSCYPNLSIDDVPEEHRHILAYRLEWFLSALRGHQELIDQKFKFRSAIATMAMKLSDASTSNRIVQIRHDFDQYIGERLPKTM
jgi:hypothetical protein